MSYRVDNHRSPVWTVVTASVLAIVAILSAGTPAHADPRRNNIGTSTKDKMYPGDLMQNGEYTFWMQEDGNLVLYHDPGRVCWASNTSGLPGTYADYDNWPSPQVHVINKTYGVDQRYWGAFTTIHYDGNLSLNRHGEVWIGWRKWLDCDNI